MVEYLIGNFGEAEAFMSEGLQLAWALGFTHIVALLLAALAGPLGRRGDPTKAATLLGASATLRRMSGSAAEATDQLVVDGYAAVVHDQMSEKAFESAHLEGSAMALEDAVALALEESTSSASDS
jgi:hypothetical protein